METTNDKFFPSQFINHQASTPAIPGKEISQLVAMKSLFEVYPVNQIPRLYILACVVLIITIYVIFFTDSDWRRVRRIPQNKKRGPVRMLWQEKEFIYLDPEIKPVDSSFDWKSQKPRPYRPFKNRPYHLTMGLQNSKVEDTFLIEDTYLERTNMRRKLVEKGSDTVETCSGYGPSGFEGLCEFYVYMTSILLRRYPMYFQVSQDGKEILNKIRNETIPVDPTDLFKTESGKVDGSNMEAGHRLNEIIAGTIEEDFLILTPDNHGYYILRAGCSCFPNGFDPAMKFNHPLAKIHNPVPQYTEKLEKSMDRFFSKIRPGEYVERYNWSIQTQDKLFAPSGNHAKIGETAKDIKPLNRNDIDFENGGAVMRVERQVLTRLPDSKANVFVIRTYTTPLSTIKKEGRGADFIGAINGLPDDIALYKRRPAWGDAVKQYMAEP